MTHHRSGRIAAAACAALAIAAVQGGAAQAQYERGCQYYAVTSCAGDKWQALGYSSRGECYAARYQECQNGGPIEAALRYKPEPLAVPQAPARRG